MFGRVALSVLGLLMLLSPMGTAQQPYDHQLLVSGDGIEVQRKPGHDRLMPGEAGIALFRFSVYVPPLAVCHGPIEMTYKARPAEGQEAYGLAEVTPATQSRTWGQPIPDAGAAPSGTTVGGLETQLRFTLAENVPAFESVVVEVWAWARPASEVPGCTLAESAPVMQAVQFRADYVPKLDVRVGKEPYSENGIFFEVQNLANGPSRVSAEWVTPAGGTTAYPPSVLQSRISQGRGAEDVRIMVLEWAQAPADWTGMVRVQMRSDTAGIDLRTDETLLEFDPSRAPAVEYETAVDPAELPSAGLLGALAALGWAASRRRWT